MKRFKLQNRYQDSGWEDLDEEFDSVDDAYQEAAKLSRNSFAYGMVRVVDSIVQSVVVEFPAS